MYRVDESGFCASIVYCNMHWTIWQCPLTLCGVHVHAYQSHIWAHAIPGISRRSFMVTHALHGGAGCCAVLWRSVDWIYSFVGWRRASKFSKLLPPLIITATIVATAGRFVLGSLGIFKASAAGAFTTRAAGWMLGVACALAFFVAAAFWAWTVPRTEGMSHDAITSVSCPPANSCLGESPCGRQLFISAYACCPRVYSDITSMDCVRLAMPS